MARNQTRRPRLLSAFLIGIFVLQAEATAETNTVCVHCEAPAATYSCSYAPGALAPPSSGQSLRFACIRDIAERFAHRQCSVRRNQSDPCQGLVHMIAPTGQLPPQETAGTDAARAADRQRPPQQPAAEPRTVVELARQTADSTQRQFDRSRETVNNAMRSTWQCLASLFNDC